LFGLKTLIASGPQHFLFSGLFNLVIGLVIILQKTLQCFNRFLLISGVNGIVSVKHLSS